MARRTFSSDEPTRLPNMRPMSKRSSGSCQSCETALAHRLLPQPCTPSSRMPFGARQAERARLVGEGHGALVQPVLQHARPPTLREVLARRVILQQAALADDLLLLGKDLVDVVAAQALVLDDDLGEDILRLAQRQAQRRLQQPLAARRRPDRSAPA